MHARTYVHTHTHTLAHNVLSTSQVVKTADIWMPTTAPPLSSAAAAEREYVSAMAALHGLDGSPKDVTTARQRLEMAASRGHTEARGALGYLLLTGLGGERVDWQRAARVLQLAVDHGDVDACGYLAWITFHGLGGVEKSAEQAAFLCAGRVSEWTQRAKRGDAAAQSLLGWCNFNGISMAKDTSEAVRL